MIADEHMDTRRLLRFPEGQVFLIALLVHRGGDGHGLAADDVDAQLLKDALRVLDARFAAAPREVRFGVRVDFFKHVDRQNLRVVPELRLAYQNSARACADSRAILRFDGEGSAVVLGLTGRPVGNEVRAE